MESKQYPRLFEKAVILNISFGMPGTTRKVKADQVSEFEGTPVTVHADKELVKVSKTLLDCDELRAVSKKHSEIKAYINARALPSFFRGGLYFWPIALIEEAEERFTRFDSELGQLIDVFLDAYPDRRQEALDRLGRLGDLADYPTLEAIRESFYFTRQYLTFEAPDNLPEVIRQREAEKMEQYMRDASNEIQEALRVAMAGLVDKMVDRLTPEDGKPKVFRDSLIGNMEEFLESFKARNLTDDTDLENLVDKAKGLLRGVDPETLRKSRQARDSVKDGFETIQANLDAMITTRTRRIVFEDEQAPAQECPF